MLARNLGHLGAGQQTLGDDPSSLSFPTHARSAKDLLILVKRCGPDRHSLSVSFHVGLQWYSSGNPDPLLHSRWRVDDAKSPHPLSAIDIKRAQDALQNDPFVMAYPEWTAAIKQMLEMGVRAEQQALAKWGLNYVVSEYLPKKLADPSRFLP